MQLGTGTYVWMRSAYRGNKQSLSLLSLVVPYTPYIGVGAGRKRLRKTLNCRPNNKLL